MKTIGVLGGMGPQATMDFERRVHTAAQKLIPPQANSGYPPMVVCYHRAPPILLKEDGTPRKPLEPDPDLLRAAEWLGGVADFIVITSNMPHLIQAEIEQASGKDVLSMVEAALDEVRARGWTKVGVLGMGEPTVYTRPLDALGISSVILEADARAPLNDAILHLMEGREDAESHGVAVEAVDFLRSQGVDGIILGCTEIPLLLGEDAYPSDLLSPLPLLADAAVARAIA